MTAPPAESEQLAVVFLGSFNPKIFQPEWFARHSLVTDEESLAAKVTIVSEQVTDIAIQEISIKCIYNRLSVETSNATRFDMVFDLTIGIFTLLPHIPVNALGINPAAHFPVPSERIWHKIGDSLAPKEHVWTELFDNPGMKNLTIQALRSEPFPGPLLISVEPSSKISNGLFVAANWHYEVPKSKDGEQVTSFLKSEWPKACKEPARVAAKIFEKL